MMKLFKAMIVAGIICASAQTNSKAQSPTSSPSPVVQRMSAPEQTIPLVAPSSDQRAVEVANQLIGQINALVARTKEVLTNGAKAIPASAFNPSGSPAVTGDQVKAALGDDRMQRLTSAIATLSGTSR